MRLPNYLGSESGAGLLLRRKVAGPADKGGPTPDLSSPLVANVAEAGDISLYALFFAIALAVGLLLLGVDAAVRRLGDRSGRARRRPGARAARKGRAPRS